MNQENKSEPETHQERNPQSEQIQNDTVGRHAFDSLILGKTKKRHTVDNINSNLINDSYACNSIDSEDSSDIADCSIDFSDDSIISELDDVDQQIFASARKGKLTLEEVIRLLSSRKRKTNDENDHDDNQLVKVFCPFSFDIVYLPIKLAGLLKQMWSSGIETHDSHFVQRGSEIGILFSSVIHANRFLKFCCTPDCSYLAELQPQKLSWCNLVNIKKKWKFKIKPQLSKDSTTLELVIQISFPKSDLGFIVNQFNMLSNPFCD
jgi:hypothetical protein